MNDFFDWPWINEGPRILAVQIILRITYSQKNVYRHRVKGRFTVHGKWFTVYHDMKPFSINGNDYRSSIVSDYRMVGGLILAFDQKPATRNLTP